MLMHLVWTQEQEEELAKTLKKQMDEWTKERLVEEANTCPSCGVNHNGLQCPLTHWVTQGTTA